MFLSVLAAVGIWVFFIRMRGWAPPAGEEASYSTYFHWLLLAFLALQLTMLVFATRDGTTGEVWLDTITSLIPMLLAIYVLALHWGHHAELPLEQLRYAKSVSIVMAIDFLVDFAITLRAQRAVIPNATKAVVTVQAEPVGRPDSPSK